MKLILVQTAFLVLLVVSGFPSCEGDAKALMDWVDKETRLSTRMWATQPCINQQTMSGNVLKYSNFPNKVVTTGQGVGNDARVLVGNCDGQQNPLDPVKQSDTHFLPYQPDKASYRYLDNTRALPWFFTESLSGCDVWVVDGPTTTNPMAIVHINANIAGNPVQNLQAKENKAFEALNIINNERPGAQYRFIQRISYDYAKMYPGEKDRISQYWNTFKQNNPLIPYVLYYPKTYGFFYGRYVTDKTDWYLHLKDLGDGKVLKRFHCDDHGSSCSIQ